MRRVGFRIGLAALAVATACPTAHGYTPPPLWSFTKPSPDGKYLFVLIGEKERATIGGMPEPVEAKAIRARYPNSGLYPHDGSKEPLWIFEGLCRESSVTVVSDGVHLVVHTQSASSLDDRAVSFYANGQHVQSYRVGELVDNPSRLRYSATMPIIDWTEAAALDHGTFRYTLTTMDGNTFVFDVRTGETVSAWRPAKWFFKTLSLLVAGLLLLKGATGLFFREWFYAWRKKQYNSERVPRAVFIVPVFFAILLTVVWYATIKHYRSWGWIVTGFITGACAIGLINLPRRRSHRERTTRLIDRPRATVATDLTLVALGLGFAALGTWVY